MAKLMIFICLAGASMAAQWYWPPAVGALIAVVSRDSSSSGVSRGQSAYIEANSARIVKMAMVPTQPKM